MIQRPVHEDNLRFGLSILHGWIRFFECLLHVAYKIPLQKWQARTDYEKRTVAETKKEIQKKFKETMGLIVDQPKPGFGNTNDGNTARRFFQNAEKSAEITKIDVNLIKKMHVLLIAVSSGHEINNEKFKIYAHNTGRLFVETYPWYNMPPTLHKYFIHGPEIVSNAILPIGQLSEEAQEARNKDFKKYREFHSRKCSREKSNQDIFNMFLITSDPIISSMRKLPTKKVQSLPEQAIDLIVRAAPNKNYFSDVDDNEDDDEVADDDDDDVDDLL